MKRTFVGALLFLILVGEPTVGRASGLFGPGVIVFIGLYVLYFLLVDSLVMAYRLTNWQLVLINFVLYSVFITGFLHGELRDYVLYPHRDLITTLIRLQSALFPVFAYQILQRYFPARRPALSLAKSTALMSGFVILMSLGGRFGIKTLINTIQTAPAASMVFLVIGVVSLLICLSRKAVKPAHYHSKGLFLWSWLLLVLGCLPFVAAFLLLVFFMIGVGTYYLIDPKFRQSASGGFLMRS